MPWPEPMGIVEVTWQDAHSGGGWKSPDEHRQGAAEPYRCRSVGYLLEDSAERVIVVQSRASVGDVSEALTIPRGVVTAVRMIRKAGRKDG